MSGAGGLPGDANAINDSGQVAGTREYTKLVNSCQKRFPLATLWTPTSPHGLTGSWIDLGSAGYSSSAALALNSQGVAVGYRQSTAAGKSPRAAIFEAGSEHNLNDLIPTGSGWLLSEATGINDGGEITGYGIHNGQTRAFLLTPG